MWRPESVALFHCLVLCPGLEQIFVSNLLNRAISRGFQSSSLHFVAQITVPLFESARIGGLIVLIHLGISWRDVFMISVLSGATEAVARFGD